MRTSLPEVQSSIYADAQMLRAHPEFKNARNVFARRYVAVLKNSKLLTHMATDEVRQVVGVYVLDRHFSYASGDPSSGVTVSDVQAFCASLELAGHNRIGTLLNLLRQAGYLHQRKEAHDRRIKRLEVTHAAIATSKRLLTPPLIALSLLEEVSDAISQMEANDTLLAGISQFLSRYFLTHGSLVDLIPDIRLFMSRNAGYEILLKLVSTDRPGEVRADRTVHFHYGATADYFGVSRVHVRRLLEDAEAAGYVSLHAPGGRAVEVHPSLAELVDRFVALQLALLLEGVKHSLNLA
ncbi:hypothetical protein ACMDCR_05695 [Labrys okinawensis]|uniref:hypothetical protein n=1 Tax=Labrys okinawensis TaxID=346911 RepID=UPI0039BC2A5A